jgi:hypothetical protein
LIKNPIAHVAQGSPMKLLGFRQLSLVLIVALLFCHGVFGSLHLLCYSTQCAGHAEHAAEHHAAAGARGDGPEHPGGHVTSTGYFAVLAFAFLGLLLGMLPGLAPLRLRLDARRPATLRQVPAVVRPPPTPTRLTLQVFRL